MPRLIPLDLNNSTTGMFLDQETGKPGFYVNGTKVFEAAADGTGITVSQAITLALATLTSATLPETLLRYAEATIPAADIVATTAGKFGHANGQEIVAAPGAGKAIEHIASVIIYDYATAAYTGGGNVSVNYGGGGGAVSGVVSAANSIGASVDKTAHVLAVVPTNNQLLANTGLNLVTASAFTQPGTAAGVVRTKTIYRVHTTGL